jgi:4-hydroxy-tetrahydrodipicolinate synthase
MPSARDAREWAANGDYPHSRPPQAILPEEAKVEIRQAFERAGLVRQLAGV